MEVFSGLCSCWEDGRVVVFSTGYEEFFQMGNFIARGGAISVSQEVVVLIGSLCDGGLVREDHFDSNYHIGKVRVLDWKSKNICN